jgi:magnesium-transporting ATPase (P-type)
VLAYAYRDFDAAQYNQFKDRFKDIEDIDFRIQLESDLIYVGTFGLEDPLRDGVTECVELIRYGQKINYDNEDQMTGIKQNVNVRMMSGDHIETCRQVAF